MERVEKEVGISLKNIERLECLQRSVDKRKSAHIREIARSVLRLFPNEQVSEEGDEFRRRYLSLCNDLSSDDRMELCGFLAKESRLCGLEQANRLLDIQISLREATVVYVKNALSDIAFKDFSDSFERVKVYYASDFESALEDVYYSRADYAILPIYSSKMGYMQHFFELMLRYEMKAVLSREIHSNTDDSDTTFLLLSKSFEDRLSANEGKLFDVILGEPRISAANILKAAQSYGFGCSNIYFTPEKDAVLISLDASNGDIDALCLYLFLESPRHVPLGLYKRI